MTIPDPPRLSVEQKCGNCRYYCRDEHGGGRGECAMRPENSPWERYRFGLDTPCSILDNRFFPEFKPNAEVMDAKLAESAHEIERLKANMQIRKECDDPLIVSPDGSSWKSRAESAESALSRLRAQVEQEICLHCKQAIESANGTVCDVCAHRLGICNGCSACGL